MGLLDFLNSDLKIRVSNKGDVKEYIISYPQKKASFLQLSPVLLRNVLKESSAIININTSLSFSGEMNPHNCVKELKKILRDLDVPFEYRVIQSSSRKSTLEKLFSFGKKESNEDILTFKLAEGFQNDTVLDLILSLGCEVFVPFEEKETSGILSKVFNSHYEDDEDRYSAFKFVLFISNFVQQSVIRTSVLDLKDVETICKYEDAQ